MNSLMSSVMYIFYIQLFCVINSQWTEIWYDAMEQNNNGDWSTHTEGESEVFFNHTSKNCNGCTRIKARFGDCSIKRSTDISAYSSIRLRFDLSLSEMETDDRCRVHYAYDNESNKEEIQSYSAPTDDSNAYHLPTQTINFPQSSSSHTLWIYFETDSSDDIGGGDNCLVDNVYLFGILKTEEPTPSPTSPPIINIFTTQPSYAPTQFPSNLPTKDPSTSRSSPTKEAQSTTIPTKEPSEFAPFPPSIAEVTSSLVTDTVSETTNNGEASERTTPKNDSILFGIVGLAIATVIVFCALVVFCCRYSPVNKLEKIEENLQIPSNNKEKKYVQNQNFESGKPEYNDDFIDAEDDAVTEGNNDRTLRAFSEVARHMANKQKELMDWLQSNGLEHCATNFMSNGYDSLDFVKEIATVQELIDIGVQNEEDQQKIMRLISIELKDRNNIAVDEFIIRGDDETEPGQIR